MASCGCRYVDDAADTVFKEAAAQCEAKLATLEAYKARSDALKAQYEGEPVYYSYNSRRKCICCGRKEKLEYVHIYFLGGISQRAFSHWNEV